MIYPIILLNIQILKIITPQSVRLSNFFYDIKKAAQIRTRLEM